MTVYTHTLVKVSTYTHARIHTHTYTYIHNGTQTCIPINMYIYTYTYLCICIYIFTYVRERAYVYINTRMHMQAFWSPGYLHIYIYVYIYTYLCAWVYVTVVVYEYLYTPTTRMHLLACTSVLYIRIHCIHACMHTYIPPPYIRTWIRTHMCTRIRYTISSSLIPRDAQDLGPMTTAQANQFPNRRRPPFAYKLNSSLVLRVSCGSMETMLEQSTSASTS